MKRDASLAEELGHIREIIKDAGDGSNWTREDVNQISARLLAAMRLAQFLERELDIYRREDDGQRCRIVCEQLAAEMTGDMTSNVVRPDFGGRS